MTTTYTPEQIAEARKAADRGATPGTDDWARRFVTALGLTVEDPKPEPGIYLHDDGTVIEVYGETPTPVQAFHESSDWLAENRAHLTPARVVPAEPVELTEEQVGDLWRSVAETKSSSWHSRRLDVVATVNAALAKYGHGHTTPSREDVRAAIKNSDGAYNMPAFDVDSITYAVMTLLEGGKA